MKAYRAMFNKYQGVLVELKEWDIAWENNPGHIPEVEEDFEGYDINIYIFFELEAPTIEAAEEEAKALYNLYDGVHFSNAIPRPVKVDMRWGM